MIEQTANLTFNIKRLKNEETVNIIKLTKKRTVNSARRHWSKLIYNSLIIFKKKLLLSDTQIVITTILNELFHLLSVSVLFISVLFSAYHSNSIIHTSFFTSLFKTDLISTSD